MWPTVKFIANKINNNEKEGLKSQLSPLSVDHAENKTDKTPRKIL